MIGSGCFLDVFNGRLDTNVCTMINIETAEAVRQTGRSDV